MLDAEPFFTEVPSAMQMTEAYNWYAANKTWADSHKWIVEWLLKEKRVEEAAHVKALLQHEISWVSGWVCRLQLKGSKVDEQSIWYRELWLKSFSNKYVTNPNEGKSCSST